MRTALALALLMVASACGGDEHAEPEPAIAAMLEQHVVMSYSLKTHSVVRLTPPATLDEDDLGNLRKGIELFAFFTDVVPHRFQADDEGFLGSIPHDQLSTPYADRSVLEVGKGDWVIVNPTFFEPMLRELEPQALLDKYDEFVKYIASLVET